MKATQKPTSTRQRQFILRSPLAVCLWLFLIVVCLVELAQQYGEGLVNSPANILSLARLRADLPHATELWRGRDIVSYDIDVEGLIPLACQFNVTLEVRQGNVTGVIPHENGAGQLQTLRPEGMCTYTFLLIPSMLESVKGYVEDANPFEGYLEVSFDPDYGFVKEYRGGSYRYGISDSSVWFTYHNFKPLDP